MNSWRLGASSGARNTWGRRPSQFCDGDAYRGAIQVGHRARRSLDLQPQSKLFAEVAGGALLDLTEAGGAMEGAGVGQVAAAACGVVEAAGDGALGLLGGAGVAARLHQVSGTPVAQKDLPLLERQVVVGCGSGQLDEIGGVAGGHQRRASLVHQRQLARAGEGRTGVDPQFFEGLAGGQLLRHVDHDVIEQPETRQTGLGVHGEAGVEQRGVRADAGATQAADGERGEVDRVALAERQDARQMDADRAATPPAPSRRGARDRAPRRARRRPGRERRGPRAN